MQGRITTYQLLGLSIGFLLLMSTACTPGKKLASKNQMVWAQQIESSPGFSKSFTGFSLIEAKSGKVLHEYDANKYFTPASNTKILTLYTCLNLLKDSIPALRYEVRGDSLLFWGTGDPTLLHSDWSDHQRVIDFLKSRKERLFFCPTNFADSYFGAGWAWDDYNYAFQAEKSPMPIYGNTVHFSKKKNSTEYEIYPARFSTHLLDNPKRSNSKAKITRQAQGNIFEYNLQNAIPHSYKRSIPFHYSHELLVALLGDLLNREVGIHSTAGFPSANSQTLYSTPVDKAYKAIMQESNNFVSEQLLLTCANQTLDTLSTKKIIKYAQEKLFTDLPDRALWVDGSGLSRYNLLTPRTLTKVLLKIFQLTDQKYVLDIFPAGGETGTIKNWYGGKEKPYVFAKSGTLSNKHCLSGYLIAKSGQLLIFSFMHNNYTSGAQPLQKEMENILNQIHLQY